LCTSANVSKNSRSYLTISLAGFFGSSSYSATFCCTCRGVGLIVLIIATHIQLTNPSNSTCFLTAKPAPLPNPAKGFADLPPGRKDKGRRETSSASIVLCSSLTRPSICQLRTSAQQGNHAKHQPWHQPQGILRIKGSQFKFCRVKPCSCSRLSCPCRLPFVTPAMQSSCKRDQSLLKMSRL